jgi:uncharacterized protein (DUF433 family)
LWLQIVFLGMDYRQRISIDPLIRSGKPCVRGTRIAVSDVLDYLAGGMSIREVLDDFPDLAADDIQACIAFAAEADGGLMAGTA